MNVSRLAILATSVSLLATLSVAGTSQCAPQQKAVQKERVACPSTDFATFFHEFSEKAVLQKTFTRFPLLYGEVDLRSEGAPFIEEKINSYDKIPTRNRDNDLIFPDEKERTTGPHSNKGLELLFQIMEGELRFSVKDGFTDNFQKVPEGSAAGKNTDTVTVLLYLEESGF
jgi:hypothetical protein